MESHDENVARHLGAIFDQIAAAASRNPLSVGDAAPAPEAEQISVGRAIAALSAKSGPAQRPMTGLRVPQIAGLPATNPLALPSSSSRTELGVMVTVPGSPIPPVDVAMADATAIADYAAEIGPKAKQSKRPPPPATSTPPPPRNWQSQLTGLTQRAVRAEERVVV